MELLHLLLKSLRFFAVFISSQDRCVIRCRTNEIPIYAFIKIKTEFDGSRICKVPLKFNLKQSAITKNSNETVTLFFIIIFKKCIYVQIQCDIKFKLLYLQAHKNFLVNSFEQSGRVPKMTRRMKKLLVYKSDPIYA